MSKNKTGFTLIELLVVIVIIAILSIIGLVAYGNFMKNSRDSKRQADLKIIQSALEDYHADQLYYPPLATACTNGQYKSGCALTNPGLAGVNTAGSKTYLNTIPTDPKGALYSYTQSGCSTGSTGYCLGATMENTPPSSDSNCNLSGSNYCVTRP